MLAVLLVALSLAAAPATKTVTKADDGKTVTISQHQVLQIKLDECGGCGYSWRTTLKPDPKVLKLRAVLEKVQPCPTPDPSTPNQQPPCPTGRPETTVFRYDGKAAGRTALRLGNFGPGRNSKAADGFRLTVRVR